MSNEEEKIANENLKRIRPQSPCKRFKGKPLGKNEYWSPNLVMSKKIEKMDIDLCDKELSNWKDGMSKKEELQDDEEEIQDDEPLTLINAQSKGHFS